MPEDDRTQKTRRTPAEIREAHTKHANEVVLEKKEFSKERPSRFRVWWQKLKEFIRNARDED